MVRQQEPCPEPATLQVWQGISPEHTTARGLGLGCASADVASYFYISACDRWGNRFDSSYDTASAVDVVLLGRYKVEGEVLDCGEGLYDVMSRLLPPEEAAEHGAPLWITRLPVKLRRSGPLRHRIVTGGLVGSWSKEEVFELQDHTFRGTRTLSLVMDLRECRVCEGLGAGGQSVASDFGFQVTSSDSTVQYFAPSREAGMEWLRLLSSLTSSRSRVTEDVSHAALPLEAASSPALADGTAVEIHIMVHGEELTEGPWVAAVDDLAVASLPKASQAQTTRHSVLPGLQPHCPLLVKEEGGSPVSVFLVVIPPPSPRLLLLPTPTEAALISNTSVTQPWAASAISLCGARLLVPAVETGGETGWPFRIQTDSGRCFTFVAGVEEEHRHWTTAVADALGKEEVQHWEGSEHCIPQEPSQQPRSEALDELPKPPVRLLGHGVFDQLERGGPLVVRLPPLSTGIEGLYECVKCQTAVLFTVLGHVRGTLTEMQRTDQGSAQWGAWVAACDRWARASSEVNELVRLRETFDSSSFVERGLLLDMLDRLLQLHGLVRAHEAIRTAEAHTAAPPPRSVRIREFHGGELLLDGDTAHYAQQQTQATKLVEEGLDYPLHGHSRQHDGVSAPSAQRRHNDASLERAKLIQSRTSQTSRERYGQKTGSTRRSHAKTTKGRAGNTDVQDRPAWNQFTARESLLTPTPRTEVAGSLSSSRGDGDRVQAAETQSHANHHKPRSAESPRKASQIRESHGTTNSAVVEQAPTKADRRDMVASAEHDRPCSTKGSFAKQLLLREVSTQTEISYPSSTAGPRNNVRVSKSARRSGGQSSSQREVETQALRQRMSPTRSRATGHGSTTTSDVQVLLSSRGASWDEYRSAASASAASKTSVRDKSVTSTVKKGVPEVRAASDANRKQPPSGQTIAQVLLARGGGHSTAEQSPRGQRWRDLFNQSPGGGPSFFDLYAPFEQRPQSPGLPYQDAVSAASPSAANAPTTAVQPQTAPDSTKTDGVDTPEWRRLVDWLRDLDMECYVQAFASQGLTTLSSLELLAEEDLKEIGIKEEDRQRLLQAIHTFSLRTRLWTTTALDESSITRSRTSNSRSLQGSSMRPVDSASLLQAFDAHEYAALLVLWERLLQQIPMTPRVASLGHELEVYLRVFAAMGPAFRGRPDEEVVEGLARFRRYIEERASHPMVNTPAYAAFAGLHLVPRPQEHPFYRSLFDPSWTAALRERLRLFFHAMDPQPNP